MEGNSPTPKNTSVQRQVEQNPPGNQNTAATELENSKTIDINDTQNTKSQGISHENENLTSPTTSKILTPAPHVDDPNPLNTQQSSTNIQPVLEIPTQITVNTEDVRQVVNNYIESKKKYKNNKTSFRRIKETTRKNASRPTNTDTIDFSQSMELFTNKKSYMKPTSVMKPNPHALKNKPLPRNSNSITQIKCDESTINNNATNVRQQSNNQSNLHNDKIYPNASDDDYQLKYTEY